MDYENIKIELESEIESLLQLNEYKTQGETGLNKIKASANHMQKGEAFSHAIIDKLNEILNRHGIKFKDDDEKEKLMAFVRPVIAESIRKFVLN